MLPVHVLKYSHMFTYISIFTGISSLLTEFDLVTSLTPMLSGREVMRMDGSVAESPLLIRPCTELWPPVLLYQNDTLHWR